jgi:hypothetical protein
MAPTTDSNAKDERLVLQQKSNRNPFPIREKAKATTFVPLPRIRVAKNQLTTPSWL